MWKCLWSFVIIRKLYFKTLRMSQNSNPFYTTRYWPSYTSLFLSHHKFKTFLIYLFWHSAVIALDHDIHKGNKNGLNIEPITLQIDFLFLNLIKRRLVIFKFWWWILVRILVSIPNLEGHPVEDTLFRVQKVKKVWIILMVLPSFIISTMMP